MAIVIENPPLWRRLLPIFQGFDGPLTGGGAAAGGHGPCW